MLKMNICGFRGSSVVSTYWKNKCIHTSEHFCAVSPALVQFARFNTPGRCACQSVCDRQQIYTSVYMVTQNNPETMFC